MRASPGPRTLVARGYPVETDPRVTICFAFIVRSHLQGVSRLSAQGMHPYPPHYRVVFASSRISSRLRPSPHLRSGDSGDLCLAPPRRANPAYHVSRFVPTKGLRTPLYTGGDHACVGRPLKSPDPAPHALLALEPLSRLSSARLTMCNTEAARPLSLSLIPRSRFTVRLGVPTPAACLRRHRYPWRLRRAGTGDTTP